jgi:hypothetical protein
MYILLVGPPGCGKGNAMKELATWLRDMEGLHIAPDGLTRRSFYSALENSRIEEFDFELGADVSGTLDKCHFSMTAFIEELGVFLQPGDNVFIYALCHVYDTPKQFHYKTEHAGENFIENAWFSMLSACTPKGLKDIFTEQAMEMGISARTVIIFSDEQTKVDIFGVPSGRERLAKDLKHDLMLIAQTKGEYQFTPETAEELVDWANRGFPPVPRDPRFEHYNSRRFVQIIKLCIICAVSKRQDPIITQEDLFQAKSFLLEAEGVMSGAIATLGANPYLAQQQLAMRFINTIYDTKTQGTPEAVLRQRLSSELDPRYGDFVVDDLAKARWVTAVGEAPNRVFYPRGKVDKNIKMGDKE